MPQIPDENSLLFYHGWISQQCEFARIAFEELDKKIGVSDREVLLAFAIINSAANLSKMFSASGESHAPKDYRGARIKLLRELYDITDDNPILKRRLRDDVEHFDDRIDQWTSQHESDSAEIWKFQGLRYESGDVMIFQDHIVQLGDLKLPISKIFERAKKLSYDATQKALKGDASL